MLTEKLAGKKCNANIGKRTSAKSASNEFIMKIIALEEHYSQPEIIAAWGALPPDLHNDSAKPFTTDEGNKRLADIGELRLRAMDAMGVTMQVLSLSPPATQSFEPAQAVAMARESNDFAARAVRAHPDRFEAFATLPTPDPAEAVRELERCVGELGFKGALLAPRTHHRPLDSAEFLPIFETAARLKVPIYLHPQTLEHAVQDAYYSGFGERVDAVFATAGWGWHADAGIHVLRLILSGLFDRLPDLQIIIGHWGEVVLFYLERIETLIKVGEAPLQKSITQTMQQNFYITPSGLFSQNYLRETIRIMGVDRVMFAADYPYVPLPDGSAPRFLAESGLSLADQEKIAHGNWERLTGQ